MVGTLVGVSTSMIESSATQVAQVPPRVATRAVDEKAPLGASSATSTVNCTSVEAPAATPAGTFQVRVVPSRTVPAGTATSVARESTSLRSTVTTEEASATRPVLVALRV